MWLAALFVVRTEHVAGARVDEVHLRASQAGDRLIFVGIFGRIVECKIRSALRLFASQCVDCVRDMFRGPVAVFADNSGGDLPVARESI